MAPEAGNTRILDVVNGATAVISNMTFTGGYINNNGGGISNSGNLTLNNCTVSHCTAHARSSCYGGGLYNAGTVTLNNCTFSHDTVIGGAVFGEGGGLYNDNSATINNSTFSNDTGRRTYGLRRRHLRKTSISVSTITFNNNSAKTNGPNIYP